MTFQSAMPGDYTFWWYGAGAKNRVGFLSGVFYCSKGIMEIFFVFIKTGGEHFMETISTLLWPFPPHS